MPLSLISSEFADGGRIPHRYTRLGENTSPPFQWSDPPDGTQSYALICEDPDSPDGTFRHWAIYDIPARRHELETGESDKTDLPQARNDFGETAYDGPEPPAGHGPHRYQFKLLALAVPALDVPENPDVESVYEAGAGHVVGQAELVGLFERGSREM